MSNVTLSQLSVPISKLKGIMGKHIGEKNSITKLEIIEQLLPNFKYSSPLEQYFYLDKLSKCFTQMRRQGFFVVSKNHNFFVPTKKSDLTEFISTMENKISGMQESIVRAKLFVENKGHLQIKNHGKVISIEAQ
jgi:hypothetical protein